MGSLAVELADHERYARLLEDLVRRDPDGLGIKEQLQHILRADDPKAHYAVVLDARVLLDCDILVGHLVLRFPGVALDLLSAALISEQEHLGETGSEFYCKKNIHARVEWLPGANRKPNISSLRAVDVNGFVQFSGTVTRSSAVRVLEAIRVFECTNNDCSGRVKVFASKHEVGNLVEKPSGQCPSCRRCSTYAELHGEATCYDFQEITVQEQVHRLGMGSIPRSICVLLLHDLVDQVKAGDDVVVTGVPINRWSPTYTEERCNLETVIDANTVRVVNRREQASSEESETMFERFWNKHLNEKKPLRGRDHVVLSMCPQLFGCYVPKLAVCLALAGCPSFVDAQGSSVRGEPHLLLVGDPGTGKSQFLRYAAKLAPRSVLTTGTGTTGAGLTCSVVRDGHEMLLEAGALVLADRGVCCIDEFGAIQKNDLGTIHEAMEQQTLSVAKAGLVCSLKTRTTVLAACNPRGSFDCNETLSTNTGIEAPLLSRFDILLVLLDTPDADWDSKVSDFILQGASVANPCETNASSSEKPWDIDTMRAYLAYIKKFDPQLTAPAARVLSAYYKAQRSRVNSEAGRTTVRLLESLIRIAKAHARLMARNDVAIVDAVVSVQFVELSVSFTLGGEPPALSRNFIENPDHDMENLVYQVLSELGLDSLIHTAQEQFLSNHHVVSEQH